MVAVRAARFPGAAGPISGDRFKRTDLKRMRRTDDGPLSWLSADEVPDTFSP